MIRNSLVVMTLAVSSSVAQPPAPRPGEPTTTAVILLLDDYSVVEAQPLKEGGGYAVQRGNSVEKIDAKRVLFSGDSRDAVHKYLLARASMPVKPVVLAGGFNPVAFPHYASRVQPVFMNLCLRCHGKADHPGGFKLGRVLDGYADSETTQRNSRAAAQFLNRSDPAMSPLLLYANKPHGGMKVAPLPDRTSTAYKNLEFWVHWAASPDGTKADAVQPVAAKTPATAMPTNIIPAAATSSLPPANVMFGNTILRPTIPDPHDPDQFNRVMHPERMAPQSR